MVRSPNTRHSSAIIYAHQGKDFFPLFIVLFMINQQCNDRVIMITTRRMKMFEVQFASKMLTLESLKVSEAGSLFVITCVRVRAFICLSSWGGEGVSLP